MLGQLLWNEASEYVGRTAGRVRNDHTHRPCRIGLRAGEAGGSRQRGSAGGPVQKTAAGGEVYFLTPSRFTSLDHPLGAQTRTFLIRLLLAVVPDIGCELPVASDLLPHHEIFAGDFFRHRTLGLEAEGADLSRRRRPEWLNIEGNQFRIADLLRHAFPQ